MEGPPRIDKLKLTDLEPMGVLHIDQFQYAQKKYLAIRDQLLTYSWMSHLKGTDTTQILKELDILQALFGKTKKIISANRSNLVIRKFKTYCKDKHIAHQTSSPYCPMSNSYSQMAVRRCKFTLRDVEMTKQCPQQLLQQSEFAPC